MHRIRLVIALLAILAAWSSAPAAARLVTITYTGTIDASGSYDGSDLFGGGLGSSLKGDRISVVFTFDTSRGYFSTDPCPGGSGICTNSVYDTYDNSDCGGGVCGDPTGYVSNITGAVTINGATVAFPGAFLASAENDRVVGPCTFACSSTFQQVDEDYSSTYLTASAQSNTDNTLFPIAFDQPFNVALDGIHNVGSGSFNIDNAYASFTADHVSLTVPSSAPEPSTWALMLEGFGALGVAMRMRARMARRTYAAPPTGTSAPAATT